MIAISFFNQPYLVDKIEMGAEVAIFGKWDQKKSAVTGMKVLAQVEDDMQPVYHVAQGVSQAQLIKAIKAAFDSGALNLLEENLPQVLLDKYRLRADESIFIDDRAENLLPASALGFGIYEMHGVGTLLRSLPTFGVSLH